MGEGLGLKRGFEDRLLRGGVPGDNSCSNFPQPLGLCTLVAALVTN